MKHKRLSILAAGSLLATTLMPFANVSAFSPAVSPAAGSKYTIVREITGVTAPVTNTFTYTIAPSDSNPETVSGLASSATIAFNNVAPTDGKVSAHADINFAAAQFTKVGDYTFTITETGTTDADNYPLSTNSYTAYVSVRNITGAGNVPTGDHQAILGGVSITNSGNKLETVEGSNSEVIFTKAANSTYISLSKKVTGNDANEDECFAFAIAMDGPAGTNFAFNSASTCTGNPATVAGNGTTTVYLKHNESATIGNVNSTYQIPINIDYTITEQGATDYTTYIDGSTTAAKATSTKTTVAADATDFTAKNTTSFVNNKEAAPHTGVVLSILPFIIIAMIGIFGAAYVAKTKKVTE
jgi:hypothetical protein